MNRMKIAVAALSVLIISALNAEAQTSPRDAVERCVNHVDSVVERAQNVISEDTIECVQTIRRLLACGRVDLAHQVARECLAEGREVIRRARAEVVETCDRCIDYLLSIGANRLARRVAAYCDDAVATLKQLGERQEQAISDAFNG